MIRFGRHGQKLLHRKLKTQSFKKSLEWPIFDILKILIPMIKTTKIQ